MRLAGVFYLITHVTSIVALALYTPTLDDPAAGANGAVLAGGLLEAVCAMAIVGTGVALYPFFRNGIALGYVALRTLEASIICAGIVPLLAVVTLRREGAGTPEIARALVAVHDWTFLLGPSLVLGVNTCLIAYLVRRSGIVPRWIGALGLVGGPLVLAAGVSQLFGVMEQVSVLAFVTAVPVFAWEICFAVALIVRGSRAATAAAARPAA